MWLEDFIFAWCILLSGVKSGLYSVGVFYIWLVYSSVGCQVSSVRCHASGIGCQMLGIECRASGIGRPVSGVVRQVSGVECHALGLECCTCMGVSCIRWLYSVSGWCRNYSVFS